MKDLCIEKHQKSNDLTNIALMFIQIFIPHSNYLKHYRILNLPERKGVDL